MSLQLYPLQISPAAVGQPYLNADQPLTPVGGTGPYTLAITAGALPVGLELVAKPLGTIQGTPHLADQYDYKPTTAIPFVVNPATFTVTVAVGGVGEATARGSSKQDAETAAARQFMQDFG